MGRRKWTPEEDAILADIYSTRSLVSQIHRLPGRDFNGARMRAHRLGLADASFNAWTPEEDEVIRAAYANGTPIKEAMRDLRGRKHRATIARAERLGLSGKFNGKTGSTFSWVEQAMRRVLEDGMPLTVYQLAEATGASIPGLYHATRRLHGNGLYIESWQGFGNGYAPRWMFGMKRDAKKPAAKSTSDSCRQWRARQKLKSTAFNPFAIAMQQVSA